MPDLPSDADLTPRPDERYGRRARLRLPPVLAMGLAVPPLAWLLHQQISYGVATLWCRAPMAVLHGLTVGLLVAVAGNAWWVYRTARPALTTADEPQGPSLARFLSLLAVIGGAFAALAIVAQGIPNFLLSPCR